MEELTNMMRTILSTELAIASSLGLWILENDRWLWASAQSHAFGLVGFVIVDLALAFAVARRIPRSSMLAPAAALVQVAAMLSDLVNGQPVGVSSFSFRGYLLGDVSFVALLAIQSVIMLMGLEMALEHLVHQHPRWIATLNRK